MNAEEVRAKIKANRANVLRTLQETEKAMADKTIAFWEAQLKVLAEQGNKYQTTHFAPSTWLKDQNYKCYELVPTVELAVKQHFQPRGILFVKERSHFIMCDCESKEGCAVFYFLDVSPE